MYLRVAVPVPGLDLLTYAVPEGADVPAIGSRVVVPLGSRLVTGIVIDHTHTGSGARDIKPIRKILDAEAIVPPEVVGLAQWTAEYYAAGVGDTIPVLLPPMARGARVDAHKTRRVASVTARGADALERARKFDEARDVQLGETDVAASAPAKTSPDDVGLTLKQRDALDLLSSSPEGLPTAALVSRGIARTAITRLLRYGYVSIREDRVERDPFGQLGVGSGYDELRKECGTDAVRDLTVEQTAAFDRLRGFADARTFKVVLLHGITGSGKTELYLRLAASVRAQGRRTLMLVPEIALTPAAAGVLRHAFGERVAIQHSGLSDGERHDQWQRIRRGDIDVVVGTRSAVFAPLDRVGLIVVDEEHDGSYKQEEIPRYNGRDVAIVRAQRSGALVVLGSATPSMETFHNAAIGRYARVVLERRVLERPLPRVTVVDMREEIAAEGPEVVLSRALRDSVQDRLARGEQSLVLLNRRGYATAVFCRQCAGTLDCPNCSVSLVVHGEGSGRRARCHYCNYMARVPPACPSCAGQYLEQTGFGTERVEAEVKRIAPSARVARLDRDAIRRRGALDSLLRRFRDGEIDVLVGTQMIAKGHDFPRVTLVGVVSADVGLGLADFRASERTFQLLTQVAGRAGRGEQAGAAVIQTLYPRHYSIQLACRQDAAAFYDRELQFRRAMRYPPLLALVNTIVRARTFTAAMDDAADLVQRVRDAEAGRREFHVLGPAPAPLARLRGEYRAQFLIKGTNRPRMRSVLRAALAARPDLHRRVVVDVDPLSVL